MHKFKVDQTVEFIGGFFSKTDPHTFVVSRCLPENRGDELQYRIKSPDETYERVVRESELR